METEMREQIEALKSSQPLPGSRLFSALEVIDELEQKWDEARAELVARSLTEEDSIAKIKALAAEVQALTDIIEDIYTQYDGGTDCYEWDGGEAGAHIGIAIQIDAETEKRIIALLNEKRPSNVAIDQPCQTQAKCECDPAWSPPICNRYMRSGPNDDESPCAACGHLKACHTPADQARCQTCSDAKLVPDHGIGLADFKACPDCHDQQAIP